MINVLIPIIENSDKFEEFVKAHQKRGTKFFVGIRENLSFNVNSKSVKVIKFPSNAKREAILNALQDQLSEKGKILIVRRPLTENEYSNLIGSESDIAVLKAKKNRFVAFFSRILSTLIKKLFAFSYFDDISAALFNESMFDLVCVCSNLSMASRINKFVGVEIERFEAEKKTVAKESNRLKNVLLLLAWTLLFAASIVAVVLISLYTKIMIVVVMFEILLLLVTLVLWLLAILSYSRSVAVGDLTYQKAVAIEEKK